MIQTKPKPRLSDGIVRIATHAATNINSIYGFMMKTGSSPVLLLTADIGLAQGGNDYLVSIITGTVSDTVFNNTSASGGILGQTTNALGQPLYNTTTDVVIKGGALGNVTYGNQYVVNLDIAHNGYGAFSCHYRNFSTIGKFRNFGRIIRPNTNFIMMTSGNAVASSGQHLNLYVEWIEGDYDYEDLMHGGRNK